MSTSPSANPPTCVRPSRTRAIQRRTRSALAPASPADAVTISSSTSGGGSMPAPRWASSAIAARERGASVRTMLPLRSMACSHGKSTSSRPLGASLTTTRARASSSGDPASTRHSGRAWARASSSPTKRASCSCNLPAGSCKDSELSLAGTASPRPSKRVHSVSSIAKVSSVCESIARRASRSARRIKVCLPDPGDPTTHKTLTSLEPSASRSTWRPMKICASDLPTTTPARGSPAGKGATKSDSTEDTRPGSSRRIDCNASRALPGRSSAAAASKPSNRWSQAGGSPGCRVDGAEGCPCQVRFTDSIPRPNGGIPVQAS